jgi:ubiquinone/menaquinone biosynthesis C-methylase UbiE
MSETQKFWDNVASDWDIQVGNDGDKNRILNSDPVLWRFAGEVKDRRILDAGCGTGYLTRQLRAKGAQVIGVDFSENMIAIARQKDPTCDHRVDSCSELKTIPDSSIDMILANYVLMDTPELDKTMASFYRVLVPGGSVVAIFSHPCFPQGRASATPDGTQVSYQWHFSYFDHEKCVDPPWAHFKSDFTWFHRPLSDYWRAFSAAGFAVQEFDEPRIAEENYHLASNARSLHNCKSRPYSVAFKLLKAQ